MNHQELICHLHALNQDNVPGEKFLRIHKDKVMSRTREAMLRRTPAPAGGWSLWMKNFSNFFIAPHALPIAGGIALVLIFTVGTGLVSLHASPQHRLLYQIGSTMQSVYPALHPMEKRTSMEVALLARGAQDLAGVSERTYSPAAVETVVGVVEERFARVADHLRKLSDTGPDYPFVLLVDTAHSAEVTEKALSDLKQGAIPSLQPRLADALSTVVKTKRAALAVMVTFKAQNPEMIQIVRETIGKELASVQESVGSLLISDGADQMRVNAAGDVLVQAERELHDGNYQVTLSLINEAENMVREDAVAASKGLVEGASADTSHAFSTTTPPVYETSTDAMIGDVYTVQEKSGNSEMKTNTTLRPSYQNSAAIQEEKLKEPEEFPIGFDL